MEVEVEVCITKAGDADAGNSREPDLVQKLAWRTASSRTAGQQDSNQQAPATSATKKLMQRAIEQQKMRRGREQSRVSAKLDSLRWWWSRMAHVQASSIAACRVVAMQCNM